MRHHIFLRKDERCYFVVVGETEPLLSASETSPSPGMGFGPRVNRNVYKLVTNGIRVKIVKPKSFYVVASNSNPGSL